MESKPYDELEPWERPGAVRRDCEPHRGELLARLADLAIILAVLSVLFCAPIFVALPLAVTVVLLAARDLDRMAAVQLDRRGEHQTRDAMERGYWAVRLCVLTVLLWLVVLPFCLRLIW
jgi:hypothetical protein